MLVSDCAVCMLRGCISYSKCWLHNSVDCYTAYQCIKHLYAD